MSTESLSAFKFASSYGRYLPELKRREVPAEAYERVVEMHRKKYAGTDIEAELKYCLDAMKDGLVLGSQRALQFGGVPILRKEARIYNCTTSYVDRPRFFAECFWLLLCGCGTGFSVQKHHVAKLPTLIPPTEKLRNTFVVPDTCEGWADALGVLMASYGIASQEHANWLGCTVVFDFSKVRGKGSAISTGSGKAPGPDPLRIALEQVRGVLQRRCMSFGPDSDYKLRPIDAYDVVMHVSDAVLAGGVRRSATICMFSVDDLEMRNAKTGDWQRENPQRGRSNNSAVLLRQETTWEQFNDLFMQARRQYGEPGFVWADSTEITYNPCQPAEAPVVTPDGLRTFAEIGEGSRIWSETGWTTVLKKWCTGTKPVYRYRTSAGWFLGTEHHRIVEGGTKIEVGQAEGIDALRGPGCLQRDADARLELTGFALGDGTWHRAGGGLLLNIGAGDAALLGYHGVHVEGYGGSTRVFKVDGLDLTIDDMPVLPTRRIPSRVMRLAPAALAAVLRGLYSANGSIVRDRITFKTASPGMRDDVQLALSSLGIKSYFTTNRAHDVEFENGTYACKESYDINITSDADRFAELIGFIQPDKAARLLLITGRARLTGKVTFDILDVEFLGDMEVFDITVDNAPHTYWTAGSNVSNCVEIGLYPAITKRDMHQTLFGETWKANGHGPTEGDELLSGWAFCNLCEINSKACQTKEDWMRAAKAAALLGTMQAGYTHFEYLGDVSSAIAKREALLGVSMTGMMDNPKFAFDPAFQRLVAAEVLRVNAEFAPVLGVLPTARATCVKPAGSTSCILGTSSGIHAHHGRRYFRRASANELEAPLQFYEMHNPGAVERSVWSKSGTDRVVTFCIEVHEDALTRRQVDGLKQLEFVKMTQENWVAAGCVKERCAQPWLRHNVSNTISITMRQQEQAARYIYENRDSFAGVSILDASGDLDYVQAPFCEVRYPDELLEDYGDGVFFASGLIVDGLHAFGNNLWLACDAALGITEIKEPEYPARVDLLPEAIKKAYDEVYTQKKDWVRRARQFAQRYFGFEPGDLKKANRTPVDYAAQEKARGPLLRMTYCLKEVSNLKRWNDLTREHQPVDFTKMIEGEDGTVNVVLDAACAGGACAMQLA